MSLIPTRAAPVAIVAALAIALATRASAQTPEAPPATSAAAQPASAPGATSVDSIPIRADRSRIKGAMDAPITIYEFSDFQCPFCRRFEMNTAPALDSAYIATGRVRLIYFNFPLSVHPNAWVAAEAALCAGSQGKFWPMHDRLFAEQSKWETLDVPADTFEAFAADLGLDLAAFRSCTRWDRVAPVILQDLTTGASGGINATPTFVILRKAAAGEDPREAQRIISGVQPLSAFQKAIEELGR